MLFAVSHLAQKAEVDTWCFGSCGKILCGGLMIASGPFFPCREKDCPHEEKNMDSGTRAFREKVYIRKLKPINAPFTPGPKGERP